MSAAVLVQRLSSLGRSRPALHSGLCVASRVRAARGAVRRWRAGRAEGCSWRRAGARCTDTRTVRCVSSTSPGAVSGARGGCALRFVVTHEDAMVILGELLSLDRRVGDVYCLTGPVGAGKSALCRAFIRAALDAPSLPVPSPTFLLVNQYDDPDGGPPTHHMDLYRLGGSAEQPESVPASDLDRMGFGDSLRSACCLIEWAELLADDALPRERVDVRVAAVEAARTQAVARATGLALPAEDDDEEPPEDSFDYDDVRWREVDFVAHGPRPTALLQRLAATVGEYEEDLRADGLALLIEDVR